MLQSMRRDRPDTDINHRENDLSLPQLSHRAGHESLRICNEVTRGTFLIYTHIYLITSTNSFQNNFLTLGIIINNNKLLFCISKLDKLNYKLRLILRLYESNRS